MISLAESGLPEAVYDAINEGGKSLELRVTRYAPELLPQDTTFTLHNNAKPTKIQEISAGEYLVIDESGYGLHVITNTTTTTYHVSIFDFYFDGTHIYGFRNNAGTIYREKYVPGNTTSIETLNVGSFAWQNTFGIKCADQNTLFYFRTTRNNANLYRRVYSGSWTETASEIWLFDSQSNLNKFYVQKMDDGRSLIVARFMLPGEIYSDVSGASTTYQVERNPHIFSYIWGETELNVIYQEVLKDDIENYAKILFSLNKYGDYYVAGIGTFSTQTINSIGDNIAKTVSVTISKDGKNWSEIIPLNETHTIGFSWFWTGGIYPEPLRRTYFLEGYITFGIGLDGEPLIVKNNSSQIKRFGKSARLYGFDNCDPGEDITSWIDKDRWEFEMSGVMQINMAGWQDFGNALFRHELGYWDGTELYWHQYAVTMTDTTSEEYEPSTGKTIYRVSTRDLTSWMMDRFQSYTSREWHGHHVSVEVFDGKSTKLAAIFGSIEYLTSPNRGKVIPSAAPTYRAIFNHTGQPDKRNHCITAYFEPQGGATAHIVAGWYPHYNNVFGMWINVTTSNMQARAFHNGVDLGTAAGMTVIAAAGIKYIRSQIHYGLWTIYYSTNNTTWNKVSYPIPYDYLVLDEYKDRDVASAPFALAYPGIGNYSTSNETTNFHYVINTNRNRPIQLDNVLQIGGAFSLLFDVKPHESDVSETSGSGLYAEGDNLGSHNIGFGFDILDTINTDESGGKVRLKWGTTPVLQTSYLSPQSRLAVMITAQYLTSGGYRYVATLWQGNEIFTGYFDTSSFADAVYFFPHFNNFDTTVVAEPAFVDILTIDVGESPIQGIKRALEGREHLNFFLRRTGELWLRPVTKNPNYTDDTNLITYWTSRKYEQDYTRMPMLRRKIVANVDTEIVNPNGFEGQFGVEQNTMIENPIEPVYIPVIGKQKRISYQCEIPLFQELYDAVVDGYRIQSISGRLLNGKLDGEITIGNEELL